ncbi:hypothetical protein ASG74_11515 [Knoellia sp. Soil729]|nr:hypothetical protein [Knoellia sp. Soil729]KRE42966.1 hypothetical protein ASG74_11515 [Knoellia sp. Soil729]
MAADPARDLGGLEHEHAAAAEDELVGGGESGDPGTDDDDVSRRGERTSRAVRSRCGVHPP